MRAALEDMALSGTRRVRKPLHMSKTEKQNDHTQKKLTIADTPVATMPKPSGCRKKKKNATFGKKSMQAII